MAFLTPFLPFWFFKINSTIDQLSWDTPKRILFTFWGRYHTLCLPSFPGPGGDVVVYGWPLGSLWYWRDIVFLCNTCLLLRWIPTVLCLIIGNTSHDHFNASIYVTTILKSISYLNFRLSIQTKIQLWPLIKGNLDLFSTTKNYFEIQNLTIFGSPFDNFGKKYKWEKKKLLLFRGPT